MFDQAKTVGQVATGLTGAKASTMNQTQQGPIQEEVVRTGVLVNDLHNALHNLSDKLTPILSYQELGEVGLGEPSPSISPLHNSIESNNADLRRMLTYIESLHSRITV